MTPAELRQYSPITKVVIHSIDCALYQASVFIGAREFFLADAKGKLLKGRSVLEMQALFKELKVEKMVLRQTSAYDEMVGQPVREQANTFEVPLASDSVLY